LDEAFQVAVGAQQEGRRGGLVEFAALDAEQPVLDDVATADAVCAAEAVQFADQGQRFQGGAIKATRQAALGTEGERGRLGGGLPRGLGGGENVGGWPLPGVHEVVQVDAGAPEVAVNGSLPFPGLLDGQAAAPRVVGPVLGGAQVPLPDRGEYLE